MVTKMPSAKRAKLLQVIACPECGQKLVEAKDKLRCLKCKHGYRLSDKIYFHETAAHIDKWSKASMKSTAAKKKAPEISMPFGLPNDLEGFGRPSVEYIGGPRIGRLRQQLGLPASARMLYLGSGGDDYADYIKLDYFPYKNVEVVADIHKLPFRTGVMDCVVTNSVFEHLKDPNAAFKEACRVIKKGGHLYFCVPFLAPRHHQVDYWRWTLQGIAHMAQASGMKILDYGATRGFAYTVAPYIDAVSKLPLKKSLRSFIKHNSKQMIEFFSELDTVLDYRHPLRTAFASTLFALMRK